VNPLLAIAEALYRGVNRTRRALYRAGVLRARRLPRPVISVGNIAAGGAGKTPAVIALARFLTGRGHRVCVLTRGHGRSGEGGRVETLDAARFGDEPVLIKKSVPEVDVIVGENRYQNGLNVNCDVYLLDDGFQHLQLARDLDLVIDVPGARFHREGRAALRDAGIVVPRRVRADLSAVRGKRLFAFAGLADNSQFFEMLPGLVGTRSFPDHHRYSPSDLDAVRAAAAAAGAEAIVTTEKDAVKLDARDIIAIPLEFLFDEAVLERVAATVA
jgi:tetraacyldisaccharide 4'-kinase